MEAIVTMRGEGEGGKVFFLDRDAEFFPKLADQSRFRGFVRVELAAGKFPEPGQCLAFRALRDQDALVGVDQGAGDDQGQFEFGHVDRGRIGADRG